MPLLRTVSEGVNRALAPLGVKMIPLTDERAETARLLRLRDRGWFEGSVYPAIDTLEHPGSDVVFDAVRAFAEPLRQRVLAGDNAVDYVPDNRFFGPTDASVYYALLRATQPGRVLEVGCGNSTRIARQAIIDGELNTQLVAVDPQPRVDVVPFADRFERAALEDVDAALWADLAPGDVLFIDSSHEVKNGNDVWQVFVNILPQLQPGVLIHFHDIFLPYEYPQNWLLDERWPWAEQVLLYMALTHGGLEVLWPGYAMQQRQQIPADLADLLSASRAQSFWLRVAPSKAPVGAGSARDQLVTTTPPQQPDPMTAKDQGHT